MTRKRKSDQTAEVREKRITPIDIQQKEFRLAFRGYSEKDVDVFLDEVTEELARLYAENKRLREQLEMVGGGAVSVADPAEADALIRQAHQEADAILRRARDEAARVAAEARPEPASESGEGSGLAAAGPVAVSAFVARERSFLQSLAGLIQNHAEEVKEDLRRMRTAGAAEAGMEVGEAATSRTAEETVEEERAGAGSSAPLWSPEETAETRERSSGETAIWSADSRWRTAAPTPPGGEQGGRPGTPATGDAVAPDAATSSRATSSTATSSGDDSSTGPSSRDEEAPGGAGATAWSGPASLSGLARWQRDRSPNGGRSGPQRGAGSGGLEESAPGSPVGGSVVGPTAGTRLGETLVDDAARGRDHGGLGQAIPGSSEDTDVWIPGETLDPAEGTGLLRGAVGEEGEDPSAARARRMDEAEEADSSVQRSLRELFWGES